MAYHISHIRLKSCCKHNAGVERVNSLIKCYFSIVISSSRTEFILDTTIIGDILLGFQQPIMTEV